MAKNMRVRTEIIDAAMAPMGPALGDILICIDRHLDKAENILTETLMWVGTMDPRVFQHLKEKKA